MPGLDFRENYEFETHRAQPPIKGVWGIHLSGLSCWHASFKARGRVRSMDSVDPSASQPRDGLHPVLEVRLAHAPHYKDLIARSHPAGPAISATATAGPRWNRQTWIPSANRPWLEIRVTPVKWIPPKGALCWARTEETPPPPFSREIRPNEAPAARERGQRPCLGPSMEPEEGPNLSQTGKTRGGLPSPISSGGVLLAPQHSGRLAVRPVLPSFSAVNATGAC